MKNSGSGVKTLFPPFPPLHRKAHNTTHSFPPFQSCNKFDTNRFGFCCLPCQAGSREIFFLFPKLSMKEYISGFVRWFLSFSFQQHRSPAGIKNISISLSVPLTVEYGKRRRRETKFIHFQWFFPSLFFCESVVTLSLGGRFLPSLSYLSFIHCRHCSPFPAWVGNRGLLLRKKSLKRRSCCDSSTVVNKHFSTFSLFFFPSVLWGS